MSRYALSLCLSPIVGQVENYPTETNIIGGTHFPLPWLWGEEYKIPQMSKILSLTVQLKISKHKPMSKCDTKTTASSAWQKTEVWNEVRSHFSLQGRVPTRCTWGLLTATLLWLSQVAWTHRSARCRDWPRFKVTLESRSNPLQSAFSMLHWTLASIVFSGKIMFVQGCSGKYAKYRNYERPYIIYQQLQSKAPRLLTTTSPMLNVVETPMHRSKLACLKIYHNMWDSASWEHSFRSLRICAILKIWRCIGPKKWFGHPQSTVEKREEKSRPRLLFAE